MSELNRVIDEAVARHDLPFAVAMTAHADGVTWSGAAGEAAPGKPAALDTVFRIFSMTKAVGSTAAMILMDRGKLKPDTTVESVLPEFAEIKLLEGFDADGKPKLRAPQGQGHGHGTWPRTPRASSTSSGMPTCRATWRRPARPTILSGLKVALHYPLLFEPGERWDYGIGIDWLGQMVEKIDGRRIDQFCQEEIFDPLGMNDTRFEVEPHMVPRLAGVSIRGEDGKFAAFDLAPPSHPEFYGMGHALYSTAPDYMRFLRMYLNKGQLDGKRILSEAGVATMLANQIGDTADPVPEDRGAGDHRRLRALSRHAQVAQHGLHALRGRRAGHAPAGSQGWAGVLNTHFWFDPRAGRRRGAHDAVAALRRAALHADTYERFERAAYRQALA